MATLLNLLAYLKKYQLLLMGVVVCNIFTVFFSVLSLPALKPFLDILFGQVEKVDTLPEWQLNIKTLTTTGKYYISQIIETQGEQTALLYACGFIMAAFFFKNLFYYCAMAFMAPIRNGIVADIRASLFEKTLRLPLAYFSDTKKGDLMSRMTADVQEIEWGILNVISNAVREPLMLIGFLGAMLYISPRLTAYVLLLILFTTIVIGSIGRALRKKSNAAQSELGNLVSSVEEGLSGLRIIKGFRAENYQLQQFNATNNHYKNLLNRLLWRRDLASPLSEFLGVSVFAALMWIGFREVNSGSMSVSTFLIFLGAFFLVIEPSKRITKAFYSIQKGMAGVDRINKILAAENTIQDQPNAQSIKKFSYEIEYRNVTFTYENAEKPAVKNVSITIPKGKAVALVGSSGAGKSTMVDLLPRFYDVQQGAILIDGQDIKTLKLDELRDLISIVTQDAILFNDTIYNNIAFGKKDCTEAQVKAAAEIANAHDFIIATEHGYQTNIGDRGIKLSGGQRQRLTIARAILRNTPILILDEATSALDSESEKLVQDALEKVMQDRTTLVVAHRLSTIQSADAIVVMRDGNVIEQGSHLELLEQHGEYQKLVELQAI